MHPGDLAFYKLVNLLTNLLNLAHSVPVDALCLFLGSMTFLSDLLSLSLDLTSFVESRLSLDRGEKVEELAGLLLGLALFL